MQPGRTFREYITEYQTEAKYEHIHRLVQMLGLDEQLLVSIMKAKVTEANIDEFGRFTKLKKSVDKAKAKNYFEWLEKTKLLPYKVSMKTDMFLREFILNGGVDVAVPEDMP